MAKKKVSRKELLREPDRILTASSRLLAWVLAHRIQVIAAVAAVLLLVGGISGARYVSARNEGNAFSLYQQGMDAYETEREKSGDTKAAFEKAGGVFSGLFEEYKGCSAVTVGKLAYAKMAYEAGDFETAVRLYREILPEAGDDPVRQEMVLSGLGYASAGAGRIRDAIQYFEQVSAAPHLLLTADALYQLACLYETEGDAEKSLAMKQRLVDEFDDYPLTVLIRDAVAAQKSGETTESG
ncbi:MAG: hypothetical protein CSB33_02710 [Desulfobacterales bacterium]|nr:MAG: hypothetical protein CSB33_02710 [Desulfobacterales bacterium]